MDFQFTASDNPDVILAHPVRHLDEIRHGLRRGHQLAVPGRLGARLEQFHQGGAVHELEQGSAGGVQQLLQAG